MRKLKQVAIAAAALAMAASAGADAPLRTVGHVDLERYLGLWYSVSRIPQVFEKDCAGGTTATYTLLDNGDIGVKNACYRADGTIMIANGRAWVTDKQTNARLKVSFVPVPLLRRLFAGDYWIIDLGQDYEYAVVGHPDRSYGWILSRTPELPDQVMDGIMERLEKNGYDISKFEAVNQRDYHGAR
jgi:apolipoprotein D and lipocalin family protein